FDEQHVAAYWGPGESYRDTWTARTLRHLGVGAEARSSQVLFNKLRGDLRLLARAFRDAPRLLAADGADLALQIANAGFARVPPDEKAHGGVAEFDIAVRVETVLRSLPRDQVTEGDDHLFLLRVALERNDLHAIA